MISCPNCQAENPPEATLCGQCQTDLTAAEHDEVPTLRTRPRLLVLRQAAKAANPAQAQPTDHGTDLPADPATPPPVPALGLRVLRGLRVSIEYPLFEGPNLIGRGDDRPVDIDLRDQEPRDRV